MSIIDNIQHHNYPLHPLVWFRAGGPAEYFLKIEDKQHLQQFLSTRPTATPLFCLGAGSNLLVRDGGIKGIVLRLGAGFRQLERHDENRIYAGAACLDKQVANFATEQGIGGLEFLTGIPGTIGGALAMNAGCYNREMSDIVLSIDAMDYQGQIIQLTAQDMQFSYRRCGLLTQKPLIFIGALLQGYPDIQNTIQEKVNTINTARQEAQPIGMRTGGSTFKNPTNTALKAWELIDQAGCRGLRYGDAQISEKHCNFLINTNNARAHDLETLGEQVRKRVYATHKIRLEWEIKRIGMPLQEHKHD